MLARSPQDVTRKRKVDYKPKRRKDMLWSVRRTRDLIPRGGAEVGSFALGVLVVLCLTIRQPFAALIVAGIKKIEIRKWKPPAKLGRMLVQAGLGTLPVPEDFRPLLRSVPPRLLAAKGEIIGVAEVRGCRALRKEDRPDALYDIPQTDGLFAWQIGDVWELKSYVPIRGRQKLFPVSFDPGETELERLLLAQEGSSGSPQT